MALTKTESMYKYIKIGSHLGKKFVNPDMENYHMGVRNNIAIVDIKATLLSFYRSLYVIKKVIDSRGHIFFLNTSPELSSLVQKVANTIQSDLSLQVVRPVAYDSSGPSDPLLARPTLRNNQSAFHLASEYDWPLHIGYCNDKWSGGTLTNWKQIDQSVAIFAKFKFYKETSPLKSTSCPYYAYSPAAPASPSASTSRLRHYIKKQTNVTGGSREKVTQNRKALLPLFQSAKRKGLAHNSLDEGASSAFSKREAQGWLPGLINYRAPESTKPLQKHRVPAAEIKKNSRYIKMKKCFRGLIILNKIIKQTQFYRIQAILHNYPCASRLFCASRPCAHYLHQCATVLRPIKRSSHGIERMTYRPYACPMTFCYQIPLLYDAFQCLGCSRRSRAFVAPGCVAQRSKWLHHRCVTYSTLNVARFVQLIYRIFKRSQAAIQSGRRLCESLQNVIEDGTAPELSGLRAHFDRPSIRYLQRSCTHVSFKYTHGRCARSGYHKSAPKGRDALQVEGSKTYKPFDPLNDYPYKVLIVKWLLLGRKIGDISRKFYPRSTTLRPSSIDRALFCKTVSGFTQARGALDFVEPDLNICRRYNRPVTYDTQLCLNSISDLSHHIISNIKKSDGLASQQQARLKASSNSYVGHRSHPGSTKSSPPGPVHSCNLLIVLNPNENRVAIREANSVGLPVLSFADSNTKLMGITYPVIGNVGSFKFIHLYMSWILKLIRNRMRRIPRRSRPD